jgi:hypothetical protein
LILKGYDSIMGHHHKDRLISAAAVLTAGALAFCGVAGTGALPGFSVTAQAAMRTEKELSYKVSPKLSDEQQNILKAALSLEGKIHYVWGGKASSAGWNSGWDSGGGMDCSGFVQWAYWTGINKKDGMHSTEEISAAAKEIKKSELEPGDLGLLFKGGSHYEDQNGNTYETEEEAAAGNRKLAENYIKAYIAGKSAKAPKLKGASEAQLDRQEAAVNYARKAAAAQKELDRLKKTESSADGLTAKAEQLEKQAGSCREKAAAAQAKAKQLRKEEKKSQAAASEAEEKKESGSEVKTEAYQTSVKTKAVNAAEYEKEAKTYTARAAALSRQAAALRKKAAAAGKADKARKEKAAAWKKQVKTFTSKAIEKEASACKTKKVTNHVGIYVGKDAKGRQIWVHCNGSADTVSVGTFEGFRYFCRISYSRHYRIRDGKINAETKAGSLYEGIQKIADDLRRQALYMEPNQKDAARENQTAVPADA